MKVNVHNLKTTVGNQVADLEVMIPPHQNTSEFLNDKLIPLIYKTGFHPIGREVRWCKNERDQNVLRFFGATEGRTTIDKVVAKITRL